LLLDELFVLGVALVLLLVLYELLRSTPTLRLDAIPLLDVLRAVLPLVVPNREVALLLLLLEATDDDLEVFKFDLRFTAVRELFLASVFLFLLT
jgi:hypothetical protein